MDLWSLVGRASQRSLRSRRLEFEDRPLERASIFPMFDDEGRTRMVMITAEETGRILLADCAPGLFARDWWQRHRVRLRFTDLVDASTWDEPRFADLWHFDPWWVLGEPRYQGHGSVPIVRSTNIPGYDSTVSEVVFDRDLGRVSYVVWGNGDSVRARRFTPDTLAAMARRRRAANERPAAVVTGGWQLRPFWRAM
jgi:hypothetical protein